MADTFLVEIVNPYKLLLSDDVEELTAPGVEGEFGVLPGHAHFLTHLKAGELTYRKGKEVHRIPINWGYVEVGPEKVIALVETPSL